MKRTLLCLLFAFGAGSVSAQNGNPYTWLEQYRLNDSIAMRFTPPEGYVRSKVERGTFQHWLRYLPLEKPGSPIILHYGKRKRNQKNHAAVIDIDVGERDLQQCADAVMRFRAEYLYSARKYGLIHFNFTSGDRADFHRWARGDRPVFAPKSFALSWRRSEEESDRGVARGNFKTYLDTVFIYAGSASLNLELDPVPSVENLDIGDVFIKGGFPGHAIIVVDLAEQRDTGKKAFLLAQSYMPAQSIHILKNPARRDGSAWYELRDGEPLITPDWEFSSNQLKRFGRD